MSKVYNYKLFILLFALSSIYAFVFSNSGFLERAKFKRNQKKLEKRTGVLRDENIRLKKLHRFYLDGGQLKSDVLEHGYIEKGNKYIFFKGPEIFNNKRTLKQSYTEEKKQVPLQYLRIIWVIFSILVLLFFLSLQQKKIGDKK